MPLGLGNERYSELFSDANFTHSINIIASALVCETKPILEDGNVRVEWLDKPSGQWFTVPLMAFGKTVATVDGLIKGWKQDCVNSIAMVERSAPAPVEITGTAHHIRHAVAVDEHRVKFKPALLAQDIKTVIKEAQTLNTDNKRVKAC
ncbi:hypothetical protein F25303_8731 [Fusarium sp. NRRL 25303]|nr:hypothetical protein F25303_8731 [Fusarium sp. NRRL 25303]